MINNITIRSSGFQNESSAKIALKKIEGACQPSVDAGKG